MRIIIEEHKYAAADVKDVLKGNLSTCQSLEQKDSKMSSCTFCRLAQILFFISGEHILRDGMWFASLCLMV